jgi:hypothetical protein
VVGDPIAGGSGSTPTSVRADEDALSKDMIDLKSLRADIDTADQSVQDKLDAMRATPGDTVSTADMFELQQLMIHLNQLSEMSSSIVSAADSALLNMARGIKG